MTKEYVDIKMVEDREKQLKDISNTVQNMVLKPLAMDKERRESGKLTLEERFDLAGASIAFVGMGIIMLQTQTAALMKEMAKEIEDKKKNEKKKGGLFW